MLAHPKAAWCVSDGNPIFQEMREAALASEPTFLLNVTLDQEKRITGIFAGDLVQAHDAGIEFARKVYIRPVPHQFDIALASNLGYPSDINLYQSVKGMSVAARAVRPGGAVILAAECADGLGRHHFRDLLAAADSPQELLAMIVDPSFHAYDQWGVQCLASSQVRADCYLHSSLGPEEVRRAHLKPAADVTETVAALCRAYRGENGGSEPKVLVLPYGQLTVPQLAG
jgi:nickel-dependent lactate racemase